MGDFHGKFPKLKANLKDVDCIVQIGDVCGDKELDNFYEKLFKHLKKNPETKFSEFKRKFGKKKYDDICDRSLKKGIKVMKKLDSLGKPVFFVPGNHDESYGKSRIKEKNFEKSTYNYFKSFLYFLNSKESNPKLVKNNDNIRDCQFKSYEFKGLNFIGYGTSSSPEDISRKKLKKKKRSSLTSKEKTRLKKAYKKLLRNLDDAHKKTNKKLPTIFITHNVPYKTKLDKIKSKGSISDRKHAGSNVARWFVEKHKPVLCIGGHIHEKGGKKDKIGNTTCINVGSAHEVQVLIDIDEKKGKVKSVKFIK